MDREIHISIDEAGNPADDKPFVISAVLIYDIDNYLKLYDEALVDVQRLTGKHIKFFKWSEDPPKQHRLGKNVKGIFVNKVLSNLTGISLIIDKKTDLTAHSAKIYGKIIGLNLRKYVVGKKIFVYYDRTPVLRDSDKQYILTNFHKWSLAKVMRIEFTGHDKYKLIHSADYVSGIVREYLMDIKKEYRFYIEEYFNVINKNFEIRLINIEDY
ncbi:hypothetical protein [Sulfurisphaera ohwakuensis]|uniref:DUF3800 domain-containing protein n=1 Tax=Sulfurisphaera ohwakuensis TaxID=69656 RepID=A0A650CFP1_SULOH|nr:hypothetical protein [Sulfurisphaera ohwakuensis]MBB5254076.1 hypothetical protein [Sulfurisphaera ohwakuensis]QGR16670.1 hypothetical protein D1869_05340 [Sulfurisphaera ohwakuensis]